MIPLYQPPPERKTPTAILLAVTLSPLVVFYGVVLVWVLAGLWESLS
jgi:hypothetical protein